jgi:hypothetical protein
MSVAPSKMRSLTRVGGAILLSLTALITISLAPAMVISKESAPYDNQQQPNGHQPSLPIAIGYLA